MDFLIWLNKELFIGMNYNNFSDLKPDNVFIHKGQLKIADFGFSKKLNNKRVKNVSMVGTPLYMSLEILKGKPYTSKCDIWALGLIFY
jgi:serine/threonine protein kinase